MKAIAKKEKVGRRMPTWTGRTEVEELLNQRAKDNSFGYKEAFVKNGYLTSEREELKQERFFVKVKSLE